MVDNVRRECIMSMYEIYPLSRKLVFDTFDKKKYDITRTQQIIMLSLCIEGTLTMSQLASKINTSNEQATRAVAQLVDKGFVIRMQNPDNRRVINIRLTDEAMRFMEKMKNVIHTAFATADYFLCLCHNSLLFKHLFKYTIYKYKCVLHFFHITI